jgi:hypothetical protein
LSYIASIRIQDKDVWERAKLYTKNKGFTIGKLVTNALELYMKREDNILYKIDEIREELRMLRNEFKELKSIKGLKQYEVEAKVTRPKEYELPSFLKIILGLKY